jgi:ribose 5-phosphate isomerase B
MIAIGSDHGGYALKETIKAFLDTRGMDYEDVGCHSTASCDYPVYGKLVAESVAQGHARQGIVICTTGIGISMTANKVPGIRCALCSDPYSAKMTRLHNDANILALGASIVGNGLALSIVETFLSTDFSNEEKHSRRIRMME